MEWTYVTVLMSTVKFGEESRQRGSLEQGTDLSRLSNTDGRTRANYITGVTQSLLFRKGDTHTRENSKEALSRVKKGEQKLWEHICRRGVNPAKSGAAGVF